MDFNKENVNEFTLENIFLLAEIMGEIDFSTMDFSKTGMDLGFDVLKVAMKSSKKVKEKVYELVADVTNLDKAKAKKLTLKQLRALFERMAELNDLTEVFTQAKEMI